MVGPSVENVSLEYTHGIYMPMQFLLLNTSHFPPVFIVKSLLEQYPKEMWMNMMLFYSADNSGKVSKNSKQMKFENNHRKSL